MTRSRFARAAALGGFAAAWAGSAAAETAYGTEGATSSFLKLLTERLEFTLKQIPALGRHLASLPDIVDGRTVLLLLGIVVAGLAAEYAVRLLLSRARLRGFDRLVGHSPLRAFGRAVLLDVLALIALAVAGRLVARPDRRSPELSAASSAQQVFPGAALLARLQPRCSAPGSGPARRRAASRRSTMPTARGLLVGAELGDRPAADRRAISRARS